MAEGVQDARAGVRRLAWLSLFGATCGVAGGLYVVTGRGIPCPLLELTGLLCPACGASRMGAALLRGDWAAAWGWNPFMLVLGGVLSVVWLWTAASVLLGRSPGLPGPLASLDRPGSNRLVLLPVGASLLWAVTRNLL